MGVDQSNSACKPTRAGLKSLLRRNHIHIVETGQVLASSKQSSSVQSTNSSLSWRLVYFETQC